MLKRSPARVAAGVVALLAVLAVAASLGGCCPWLPVGSITGSGDGKTPVEEVVPVDPASDIQTDAVDPGNLDEPLVQQTVVVPGVLGLYYDEAAEKISAAGLNPVDVSVHGPLDEDAGEIGKIYRQTPAAGEKVPPETNIELRSWWESQ